MDQLEVIPDIVRQWAAERPDAPALTAGERTWSWRELDERSNRVANGLRAAGVGDGDRIALIDKNGPEYFEILYGGAKIGAVNVAVNWRLAPAEMAQILNDAEAKVLFVGPDFHAHVDKIAGELATVTTTVSLDDGGPEPTYESWLAGQDATDPGLRPDAEDVALQLYTSGTTGLPKGVMLTHRNLFTLLPVTRESWAIQPSDVSMVAMPLFHIGGSGWALAGMYNGVESVLIRDIDPAAILDAIEQRHVTHAFLVPAVLQFLLMVPGVAERDLSSLRMVAYGASPITDDVLKKCLATFGCDFVQLYGLTETTGAVTQLDPADHDPVNRPDLLRSCGKPLPGVEVRVVDAESGEDVPVGQVGEIWIRTAQNMKGYWHKPDETAKAITPDGWFRSGDAGYFDDDGFIYLYDRVKDMIVSGGENVYPAEVENVLMGHPDVADVAVIGVPDEKWGEAVKAIVVKAPGSDPRPEDLIAYTRERLAGFKLPKSVDFADTLPRNPSGKLLKRELREPYWAGVSRRIG